MRQTRARDRTESVKMTVRITKDRHRDLKEMAKKLGLSQAATINLAIQRFAKEERARW